MPKYLFLLSLLALEVGCDTQDAGLAELPTIDVEMELVNLTGVADCESAQSITVEVTANSQEEPFGLETLTNPGEIAVVSGTVFFGETVDVVVAYLDAGYTSTASVEVAPDRFRDDISGDLPVVQFCRLNPLFTDW